MDGAEAYWPTVLFPAAMSRCWTLLDSSTPPSWEMGRLFHDFAFVSNKLKTQKLLVCEFLCNGAAKPRRKLTTPKLARLSTVGSKRDSVELLDRPPRSELPRTTMLHTLGDENGDPLSRMEFDNRVCVWETL